MRYGAFLFLSLCAITAAKPAPADKPEVPACGIFSASYKPSMVGSPYAYSLTVEKEQASLVYPGSTLAYFTIQWWERDASKPSLASIKLPYGCTASGHIACGLRLGSLTRVAALNHSFEEVNLLDEKIAPAAIVIAGLNNILHYMPESEVSKLIISRPIDTGGIGSPSVNLWVFDRCREP